MTGPLPVTIDPDVCFEAYDGTLDVQHVDRASVLHCRSCQQGVVVVEEQRIGDRSWRVEGAVRKGGDVTWRGIHWWPSADTRVSIDVPTQIAEVFQEAVQAQYAGCPRAAAVMARRTLEAITADKGETKGTLSGQLKNLASAEVLLPTLADWSKEVRLVGNASAHFDPINSVSTKDAEDLISFVRELLRYLYDLPADLSRRRKGTPESG